MKLKSSVLPAVVLSVLLSGCSSNLFTEGKLQNVKFFAKSDWSSNSSAGEANFNTSGPVAPEEFVDATGACAGAVMAAAPPPVEADGSVPPAGAAPQAAPVLGGVGLGMTECEVVRRAGQPGNIQIGGDANSDRSTVLTYMAGPWPGIYKFSGGRLNEVERVAMPEPPKPVKPVKKKKAAPKTAAR